MEVEKIKLENIVLNQLLNESFLNKFKEMETDINVVSIVFASKNPKSAPIILSHENTKEIETKQIHVVCPDGEKLKEFSKILKELGAE